MRIGTNRFLENASAEPSGLPLNRSTATWARAIAVRAENGEAAPYWRSINETSFMTGAEVFAKYAPSEQ